LELADLYTPTTNGVTVLEQNPSMTLE